MDMMTYLFDQETVTRDYGEAKWAEGKSEGKSEGRANAIQKMMKNIGLTLDQAMDLLEIPDNERNDYRQRLAAMTNGT